MKIKKCCGFFFTGVIDIPVLSEDGSVVATYHRVECADCGEEGPNANSVEAAVKLWNERRAENE